MELAGALVRHAVESEVANTGTSRYGTRYVIDGVLRTPNSQVVFSSNVGARTMYPADRGRPRCAGDHHRPRGGSSARSLQAPESSFLTMAAPSTSAFSLARARLRGEAEKPQSHVR